MSCNKSAGCPPDTLLAGPLGSFEAYADRVSRIPGAEPRGRAASWPTRFLKDNDLEAARQLVLSHLRFVLHIARGYSGYGLPMGDLVQEGNVGLMKAVKRFDPDQGVRLVSFAVHWIRAEIHDYVLRNWRLVKIATTKAQRKLFFNLRRMKKDLELADAGGNAGRCEGSRRHRPPKSRRWSSAFPRATCPSIRRRKRDDEDSYGPSLYLPAPAADPAEQAEDSEWDADVRERLATASRAAWMRAARTSCVAAGSTKRSPRCMNWPLNTASRPSASARSKRLR